MPFVLDASTTLAWCFEDEATPETEAVLDHLTEDIAIVPALWELEISNVMLVGERRGRLTEAQTARFVSLFSSLPITLDLAGPDLNAVVAAGRQHQLSAYDAAYLVLAEREGVPLATQDEKLGHAAAAAGVPLIARA